VDFLISLYCRIAALVGRQVGPWAGFYAMPQLFSPQFDPLGSQERASSPAPQAGPIAARTTRRRRLKTQVGPCDRCFH